VQEMEGAGCLLGLIGNWRTTQKPVQIDLHGTQGRGQRVGSALYISRWAGLPAVRGTTRHKFRDWQSK
jgi:hypothetical protein